MVRPKFSATKAAAVISISALALGALVACGPSPTRGAKNSGPSNTAANTETSMASQSADGQFATMGEVFDSVEGPSSWTCSEEKFCYSADDGSKYYLFEAELTPGIKEKIDAAEFDNEKIKEILKDVAVTRQEVFEAPDPSDLELLAGKTGAEMTEDGYEFTAGTLVVNGDETSVLASKHPFTYLISFDGKVADENTEDIEGAIKDLKVKSVTVQCLDNNLLG